ncbi:aminotransferase class V-fold PLP-dependent enzyme [Streptacidiphilus rugosus]|uniref:aminotransferase class V-fold PLP-dependent enzyme n=1 Tax=Streptacidiphilus rugosus TaxID=405783 RepID=UPI000568943B|nr:aminotransferase class V-fold PLP-dependent enzyme [Streptacidiphilus rugosus]
MSIRAYLTQFHEPPGYLDFGRYGPVSDDVADALHRAAERMRCEGPAGGGALAALEAETARTTAAAARLLGAAEHEIAFNASTSHGMFAAAYAFEGPGAVLVGRRDFPAAVYPWLRAEGYGGLKVRFVDGPMTVDAVRARLDDEVRAVCVCAADSMTGFLAPLAGLKELIGPRRVLVVDAIQALGAVPVATDAADVLAGGGQKWLRSGWGTAMLLVRDRVADQLRPGLGGWAGVRDPFAGADHPHAPLPGAQAQLISNPDCMGLAALGAGLRLLLDAGVDRIGALVRQAVGELVEAALTCGLETDWAPTGEGSGGPIARVRLPGAAASELHAALARQGLTTTLRGDWVRLSPHASTLTRDPDVGSRLVDAVRGLRAAVR